MEGIRMKASVSTALELVGLALVTAGIALIYLPAALIFAGAGLVAISYLNRGGRR
jgi:hypothetical protein